MNPTPKIRVLLVDDHFVVRIGLRSSIDTAPDIEVVAEAADGEQALALQRQYEPDVVLMDLRLPGGSNGCEITVALRREYPRVKVLFLSSYEGDEDVHRALQSGARGYLPKSAGRDELLDAIRAVHAGQHYLPPSLNARLLETLPRVELSAREIEILTYIVQGKSNKEIGAALFVSEATVKFHVTHLLQKLQANDRAHAVAQALRRGIIHLP